MSLLRRGLGLCLAGMIAGIPGLAGAQADSGSAISPPPFVLGASAESPTNVARKQRLSDWLLEHPFRGAQDPLALQWRIPAERATQRALKTSIQEALAGIGKAHPEESAAASALAGWFATLPVTGRARIALADPRWLQANPSQDPVLEPGDQVVAPARSETVTVIDARTGRCAVRYRPDEVARRYWQACGSTQPVDWLWVIQPDGQIRREGVALWNETAAQSVAPGAWIWVAPRSDAWPEGLSERIAMFLATQLPSQAGADAVRVVGQPPMTDPKTGGSGAMSLDGMGGSGGLGSVEGAGISSAQGAAWRTPAPRPTVNDWGVVGLLQTPTARMHESGELAVSASRVYPYTNLNVFMQPADWLEAGFRYTDISNRDYGASISTQAYKDKSADVKLRLWSESADRPAAALGIRDVAGTGLFAGEYLVLSKRTGTLDWSAGLGWGNVGGRGNIRNPLSAISPSFSTRPDATSPTGGSFPVRSWFHGPTALFGGVQWQTPWDRLLLKLEYDGNNYQHEGLGNVLPQRSPLNLGAVYKLNDVADLTLGFERGERLMLSLALHTDLKSLATPKLADPAPVPVQAGAPRVAPAPDWSATVAAMMAQTGWSVTRIVPRNTTLFVELERAEGPYFKERIDRATAVLHRDAPVDFDRFVFQTRANGLLLSEVVVDRNAWIAPRLAWLAPSRSPASVSLREPATNSGGGQAAWGQALPSLGGGSGGLGLLEPLEAKFGLGYQQSLGGPDAFVLYQVSAQEQLRYRISESTWMQGAVQLALFDNYDRFRYDAPSNLPRVRTYVREYLTTSRLQMPSLFMAHVGQLNNDQYYSTYAGYLESMYAGVGGEWLWRPHGSRLAFGVDLNAVEQRGFRQDFELLDPRYRVMTGHATAYWDTPWDRVRVQASVGRYLAADVGATLQISRAFENGVEVGAYATKTNVTAAQFGEGSFDKGVFLKIPFDALLARSSPSSATILWQPLYRDGGARLNRPVSLYQMTSTRDPRLLQVESAPASNEGRPPEFWIERDPQRPRIVAPLQDSKQDLKQDPKMAIQDPRSVAQELRKTRLIAQLQAAGFEGTEVGLSGTGVMSVRASYPGSAHAFALVGQVARSALNAQAVGTQPLAIRQLRIEVSASNVPSLEVEFRDVDALRAFLNGALDPSALAKVVSVYGTGGRTVAAAALEAIRDPVEVPRDRTGDPSMAVRTPYEVGLLDRVAQIPDDLSRALRYTSAMPTHQMAAVGAGLLGASTLLDSRLDRMAQSHLSSRWVSRMTKVGNALPWMGLGAAGLLALDGSDLVRQNASFAALEAAGLSYLAGTGLKYLIGRDRPSDGQGDRVFHWFHGSANSSMPSSHAVVVWAVATPFAQAYDAPWLYGLALLTDAARVAGRNHWFSDTVMGSMIGYGVGATLQGSTQNRRPGDWSFKVMPGALLAERSW
jgi:membrane-associated phospholipid phosphatase